MEKISYKTVKTWLEEITSSKYKWRRNSQDDIRFDDLETLTPPRAERTNPVLIPSVVDPSNGPRVMQFKHTLPFYRRPFAIAATVAILMIAVFYGIQTEEMKPIVAGNGQMMQVELPDGSVATLNSGSRIEFSEDGFRNGEREVNLQGEAWFKVTHGNSFIVNAEQGSVEVLGTEFNVLTRPGVFEVICDEGKVKTQINGSSVVLEAGFGARYDFNKGQILESNNLNRSSWRNGVFYFENDPILNVFAELERQYDINLDFQADADQSYTGVFRSGNLTTALDLVCKPLELEYSIQKEGENTFVLIK